MVKIKKMMFKQCLFKKGSTYKVAWIPESLAHVGKSLELREDKNWTNGWEIIEVYQIRLSKEYIEEQSQDYKHQRKMSDI